MADIEEDKISDFPIGTEKWTDILVLYPELREIVEKWNKLSFEKRYQILRIAAMQEGDESR